MTEIKIIGERTAKIQNMSIIYRCFGFIDPQSRNFGFEAEYSDGKEKRRMIFKDAAQNKEELDKIITLLIDNEVLPCALEEVLDDLSARNLI